MRAFIHLLFFVALLLVSSCCKIGCYGTEITISLENYKRLEVDTLIFLGYDRNTNFSVLKDSALYVTPVPPTDTFRATHAHSINADKNWIIKVPSVNKEFRFSNYDITTARCSCGNTKYELIRSYKVNGIEEKSLFYTLPR